MASVRTYITDESSGAINGGTTITFNLAALSLAQGEVVLLYAADDANSAITVDAEEFDDRGGPPSGTTSLATRLFRMVVGETPPTSVTVTRADISGGGMTAILVVVEPDEGETLTFADEDIPAAADGTQHSVEVTGVAGASVLVTFHANDSLFTVAAAPSGMTEIGTRNGSSHALYGYSQIDPGTGTLTKTIEWSATEEMHSAAVLVQASSGGGNTEFIAAWALGSNVVIK